MAEILITEANGNIIGTEDDDVLVLDTPVDQPFSGFIDAGAGFDRLSIAGDRRIADAALFGIEAVVLAAGARLTVDTLSIGEAPALEVQGDGAVIVDMSGQNVDGSSVSFAPGSSVTFEVHGTDKSDFITGTQANDTVFGGAKADIIKGLAGNDRLFGGQRTDNIQGGEGDDWIDGGLGHDIIVGGAGIDIVSYASLGEGSGSGVTVDLRISGAPQQTGLGGVDTIQGFENIDGSQANDWLSGNNAANRLTGNDGDDRLDGRGGNDVLLGGAGRDILNGGTGDDRMNGGADADAFVVDSAVNQGRDRIDAFGADDFVLTTKALPDTNGDGIIGFGRNGVLNIGTSTTVKMFAENGKAISALEYDGTVTVEGTTYHAYSLLGSDTGLAAIFGAG